MNTNPLLKIVAGVALVLAVIALFITFQTNGTFGSTGKPSTVVPNPQWFSGGVAIGGQYATYDKNSEFGTCNLIGGSSGIGASTTARFDCLVLGIKPGDYVVEDPSQYMTAGMAGAIYPIGAVASTTAGYVTFTMINQSGAASSTLGTNVTNSVEYYSWR